MTTTAQMKAFEERVTANEIQQLGAIYVPEVNDFPNTNSVAVGNSMMSDAKVYFPEIVDGKAQTIGLEDTLAKSGNIDLKSYELNIKPLIIRFKESNLLGTNITPRAIDKELDQLREQKDGYNALLMDSRSTSAGAPIAFVPANFLGDMLGLIDAQRTLLGVSQGRSLLYISSDIKSKLNGAIVPNTAETYLSLVEQTLIRDGVTIRYTSKITSTVYLFEGSLVDFAKGQDPILVAPFQSGDGSLAHTVWEFAFATDDLKPLKDGAIQKQAFTGVVVVSNSTSSKFTSKKEDIKE